jgi:biotin carboxylase
LYASPAGQDDGSGSRDAMLAEEFVEGREYSADFIIDGDRVTVIRVAKKIRPSNLPFGTTAAYIVPARLPHWLDPSLLADRLGKAGAAVGLTRAICMVDFIVSHEEIVFLELTPRIGGDCLPPLVRQCCGLDTIGLALDFAEGRRIDIPPAEKWTRLVGLRLFADRSGLITSLSADRLSKGRGVREVYLKRRPGHLVSLPPDDYDSWLLGHVIFEPSGDEDLVAHCEELKKSLVVDVEPHYDQKFIVADNAGRGPAQSADASS